MRVLLLGLLPGTCALIAFAGSGERTPDPAKPIPATPVPVELVAPSKHAESSAALSHVECSADVRHPIDIHIDVLDPVHRGALVRLRVVSTSAVGLQRSVVRLLDSGGAVSLGTEEVSIGRLDQDKAAEAEFLIQVPDGEQRALVQFRVEGEGPWGRIGRGATFNLLPDGPETPERIVTNATGRQVAEYAARRIER